MARVTVVDDDQDLLELLTEVLGELGHDAMAADGATVDELAASEPDVLLLDLMLDASADPAVGWELVERVRADRRLRGVPIIVTSAATPALRERADDIAALGNMCALEKPFGIDQLDVALRELTT